MILLLLLLLSGVSCIPCVSFSNEISLSLHSNVEICSPFDISQTCVIDKELPDGLNLQKDCRITGFTKNTIKKENYVMLSYLDGKMVKMMQFILGIYKRLAQCSYGVDSESIVFHENVTSSLPPPKCNTEVERCYNENDLPSFLRLSEDGSLVVSNGRRGTYEVNVICVNKVSEYKMKLKIEISGSSRDIPIKHSSISKEEKISENSNRIRNLQTIITNVWEYSDNRVTDDVWTVSKDKENWIQSNSFPRKSVITRRYRNTFTINSVRQTGPPVFQITFDDGIIVYINGKEIFRRNLPAGVMDVRTTALKSEKRNEQIVIPLNAIKEGTNYIALEVRSYSSNPSNIPDSLTCLLSLRQPITDIPLQLSDVDSVRSTYSIPTGGYVKEINNIESTYSINNGYVEYKLLSYLESREETDWFPFNLYYTFKNNVAYYFNQFSISGCSNDNEYHPKHIRIYASTDSENRIWELLYENEDLGLADTDCKTMTTFQLPVEKSYELYNMEIFSINEFAKVFDVYIKFSLFVVSIAKLPVCDVDSKEFPSVYAGTTSIIECYSGYKSRDCIYNMVTNSARWSDKIDTSHCYNENVYVSTYPKKAKTYEFAKDITLITPQSQYVTKNRNVITVDSDSELVQKFEVRLIDSTIMNLYVSVLRDVGKCSYGVEYIRIYPVEIDLELKCDNKIKPSYVSVRNLPAGLSADANGRITGMISEGIENRIYTTTITYIIDKRYDMELKWDKKNRAMEEGLEFDYFGVGGQDEMDDNGNRFQTSKFKDIWMKFDNGSYILQETKLRITFTELIISDSQGFCKYDKFVPCQNGVARMKGYIKINEDGEYTFKGKSERQKFAFRNYEAEKYSTVSFFDIGEYKVQLKKGYYVIGYLTWYGMKSNEFHAFIQKTGGDLTYLDNVIYNGGYLISHLSYNTLFVESKSNERVVLKPSYDGIISRWDVTPKIEGLSILPDGTIDMKIWKLENNYEIIKVKSISNIDLCRTSTEFQLHVFFADSKDKPQNGLKVRYYYLDSIDIENTIDISKIEDKHFVMERIETEFYHEQSDNLWTGLPEELSYSFIAEYSGYLFIDTTMERGIDLYLECYDYCRFEIDNKVLEGKGYGYQVEYIEDVYLKSGYYEIKVIYAKGNRDKRKQWKIYYKKSYGTRYDLPESSYYFNPEYPILYDIIETHYYQNTIIEIKSPMKSALFKKDIVDASYSISPSLPEGISLNDKDGSITGNSELLDENRNYTIRIDLKDGSHYYSSFSFSILPKIEPVLEYSVTEITKKAKENINVSPSSMKCNYINAAGLPEGIKIDKNGIIKGSYGYGFDETVEIDCFTYKKKSVYIHMRIISDETLPPTTISPTTEKPITEKPTTIKPTTIKPTKVDPTGNEPTTVKPTTNKVVELYFYIQINITTLTPKDINVIKVSVIAILKERKVDMSVTEVEIEMVKSRMRLLSEYNLKVTIITTEKESDKTNTVIEHLTEDPKELHTEIKSRCDEDSELYNSNIGVSADMNGSPEDESSGSSMVVIVVVVVVIIILIVLAVYCYMRHRKTARRENNTHTSESKGTMRL